MNKKLATLYLIFISSIILAQELQSKGGWVPTKQSEECNNSAHSNMTLLYFCTQQSKAYLEKIISYKLKKINSRSIFAKWSKLKKGVKLQCRKELARNLGEEKPNDNDLVNAPDYSDLIYGCIEDKYSDFNRYFLNERRKSHDK